MITKEQAAKAFERYLETRNPDDAQIVADYLLEDETEAPDNEER